LGNTLAISDLGQEVCLPVVNILSSLTKN